MKKRLIAILAIALLLVATISLPAVAAVEVPVGASVTVGEVMSITLTDAGTAGINFGSQTPPVTGAGDTDQSSGTPAIKVTVGSETNVSVDVGIKGALLTGSLALTYWKYSTTFGGTKTSIPAAYTKIYGPVGASSVNDVYHWIDVPTGTASGSHTITVTYKVVKTGTAF